MEVRNKMEVKSKRQGLDIRQITKIGICVALLCVSSYISFPIPFTPAMITAQTIIINLLALILLPREAFLALITYILLGICGLPVFSGGVGGIGKVLGPTGGYIIGYLVAAVVISHFRGKDNSMKKSLLLTILIGMPIIYIGGLISMKIYLQKDIITMITVSILPFLPVDIIKCFIGSYLGVIINKRIK